jgi:hypothetical protein
MRNVLTGEVIEVTEHEGRMGVRAREALAVLPLGLWEAAGQP